MTTPARIDDGYEFALHPPGCDDPLLSPWPRVHVLADWPIKDLDRVLEVKPVLGKVLLVFVLVPFEFHREG